MSTDLNAIEKAVAERAKADRRRLAQTQEPEHSEG